MTVLLQVLEGLKEQYSRIILLDMLGYGFSDKPVSDTLGLFQLRKATSHEKFVFGISCADPKIFLKWVGGGGPASDQEGSSFRPGWVLQIFTFSKTIPCRSSEDPDSFPPPPPLDPRMGFRPG